MKVKIRKKMNRSGNCECDICRAKEILVEHHINGKDIPDANHASNIAHLCSNCHRKVHEGLISIEGWFKTTKGLELFWHPIGDMSFSGQDAKPYIIP